MVAKRYVSPLDDGKPDMRPTPLVWRRSSIPSCVLSSLDTNIDSKDQPKPCWLQIPSEVKRCVTAEQVSGREF